MFLNLSQLSRLGVRLRPLAIVLGLTAGAAWAQTATQVVLSSVTDQSGTTVNVDTTGRHLDVINLQNSVTHNGEVAIATNQTSWDINPAAGYIQVASTSGYTGWQGSGVSLDTRLAFANFDSFTVNAGNSGLSAGDPVRINLALGIQASASTDAFKFQTGSNFLDFTIQQNNRVAPGQAKEIFSMQFDVTVYEFVEKAYVNGLVQLNNTTTYVNGQGNEGGVYAFDIELDATVGETIELAMMLGDLNPSSYTYDPFNLATGTRQDIASGQENFGNQFNTTFTWDIEAVAGFEGLDVAAASGFAPTLSAVPEPSAFALVFGAATLVVASSRRRLRR